MPSVNVSFLGVCTIFQDLPRLVPPGTPPVPPNRVVLVKTTPFMEQVSGIFPHIAKIRFDATEVTFDGPPLPPTDPPEPNVYLLEGVTLQIVNPVFPGPLLPALGCLPSLQARIDPPEEIGPPAPLVYRHEPSLAAAWFEVYGGTSWTGYTLTPSDPCDTVPSISILNVETNEWPQLLVTPWDPLIPPTTVTVKREDPDFPPGIHVANFADGSGLVEDNRDFLLNYLTAARFPLSSVNIPTENICPPSPIVYVFYQCGDAGPGCSNTQFP